ncbi:ribosome maturation factor RimM [Ktedonospora formicarum]|nr:ribosome maturation factor RimM [Ktedonospora formicarum]
MPRQNKTEWATIGKIVALFGIRGEVKVLSLTDIPDRFASLDSIYIGSADQHYECYVIESVRPYKGDMFILKFKGINSANDAEALRHQDLCISESQLAQLPPDLYYQHDILGLQVFTLGNREVGEIIDIMPTGGNDVYILRTPERTQVMIPAIKEIIKQIDLVRKVMYIDPMPGLLDDEAVIDDPNKSDEGDDA